MPDYLLDTNILSVWYDTSRPEHTRVTAMVHNATRPDPTTGYVSRLFVSVVTLGEIEYGARVSQFPDPTKKAEYATIDADRIKFIREQCPVAFDITTHVTEQYGKMRGWLFDNCGPRTKRSKAKRAEELVNPTTGKELGIDENDIWIAAQAMTHNLVLVTNDSRGNFGKVLQQFASVLTVEDWTQ